MNILRLVLAFSLGCAVQGQSTKVAKIEEIFRITKVDQMQKTMMNQVVASLPAQMEQMGVPANAKTTDASKQMIEFIMNSMSWEKMKPMYVKVYDDTFTEDEISGMLMFYESPAGKAMNAKTPELMSKMIALSQERMKEIGPEIQKRAQKLAEKAPQ